MDKDNVVEVEHVYKKFNKHLRYRYLKDLIVYHERNKEKYYNSVLKNVSFTVRRGEVLGIIGKNGSGKSTILKLLTKILRPNSGTIKTKGKIACLIELGAGFHPDMTGRENVYINASIFGLSKKSINERLSSILEFSEIGDHIDERIRNYSSGMYLRLAFSVAVNVDADILLVDEILAVGDIQFQKKCYGKINEFKSKGGTIILATHNMDQAKGMCDRVIWLDNGMIRECGNPEEVCKHYCTATIE